MILVMVTTLLLAAPPQGDSEPARGNPVVQELARLRVQVATLELALRAREAKLEEMIREVRTSRDETTAALRRPVSAAGPFLSAPPTGSDDLGVAKVAVFAPTVRVETARSHDVLTLRVRRMDPEGLVSVGETEVGRDQPSAVLPIDHNGALYLVDWSTSEGHSYSLVLQDGASGQPAVSVQVRPQQTSGRLVFVGYRIE